MEVKKIILPLNKDDLADLHAGDRLLLSGSLYAARDEAHKLLIELKKLGQPLPVDLTNQVIFYAGPAPSKPGQLSNSIGPTTAKRMDKYTADILEMGVLAMIGKGERSEETRKLLKGRAVYLAALGGIAASLSKKIVSEEIVAFEEAGLGALRRLEIVDFPVIVINDLDGNDYYEMSR